MQVNDHAPVACYHPNEKRYEQMEYRKSGDSGLLLPALSLGLWHNFGDYDNFNNARLIIRYAFDLGITYFDLANNYGPPYGSAESNFARILKADFQSHRDEMIIATKAGYDMWPGPYGQGGSKKYLTASLEQSLRRLNLDYVDIFYHHKPDPNTPIEETAQALDLMVKQGKALYIGISRYDHQQASEISAILKQLGTPLVVNQCKYSLLERDVETDFLNHNQEKTLGFVAFSPLAQGLLTNKYHGTMPVESRASKESSYLKLSEQTPLEKINQLRQIADKREQSISQMAIAWLLQKQRVTSVLLGCSKVTQLDENIGALNNTTFTKEELQAIDDLLLATSGT